jgi:hypothetical protein
MSELLDTQNTNAPNTPNLMTLTGGVMVELPLTPARESTLTPQQRFEVAVGGLRSVLTDRAQREGGASDPADSFSELNRKVFDKTGLAWAPRHLAIRYLQDTRELEL